MLLPASVGALRARTLQVKQLVPECLTTQYPGQGVGRYFLHQLVARQNHEVIYREVVFIKLSFFLSHSLVGNTYKGRML